MPWQKVVRHISDSRIVVESKSGNQYPVETEYSNLGESLYSQLSNRAHDGKTYWAFVEFQDDDGPLLTDYIKSQSKTPPENPPWDR